MGYDRDYGRGSDRYRQDQNRWQREGEERGFFDRASDEVRSWFGDEDAERRRRMDERDDDRGRWNTGDRDYGRSSYDRGGQARSYGSEYGMQGSYGRGSDRGSSYSGQGNYDRDRSSSYGGSTYGGGSGRDDQGYGRSNYGASDYGRGGYGQEERGRGGYGGRSSYGDYGTGGGGGAFGYGASQSNDDRGWGQSSGRDHDYDRWRNQQMDSLDRDYDEYRRENQSRFDNEFSSWRTTRQSQRQHLDRIEEHMEVVGSDGTAIGKVDKVRGDRVILTKTDDPEGHHHSFSSSWIDTVDTKVKLTKSADEAKKAWKDEDKRTPLSGDRGDYDQGQRTLDRSFSGTY